MEKNIETFIGCDCEYSEAKIVLFGAPYDSTTSFRPGARFGCKAIRSESFGLETYSPYQNDELTEKKVFDSGDLELVFGNAHTALGQIEERTRTILNDGKLPFMVGGEHLVTLGSFRAVQKKYPDVSIIHFDAHADLRADYLGEQMSHASVLRRCHELVGDGRIFQFGIRSGDREEFVWGKDHVQTRMFDFEGLDQVVAQLGDRPVYFTLDLDVLDPSVFPGTGTPEAGGVSFMQLLNACLKLRGLNIVGLDVNELAPAYDISGVSTAVAGKIIRELLIMLG